MIVTPKVKKWAQEHFNCKNQPGIDGAPVENEGDDASKGSHWEKVYFGSDFMTGSSVINPVISGLSMALLEDSGWYKFNEGKYLTEGKKMAVEPMYWLKDAGCEVYSKNCPNADHACTKEGESACSYDQTALGTCQKSQFQNGCLYEKPIAGGPYSDYDCRLGKNKYNDITNFFESHGYGSRCFKGTIKGASWIRRDISMCYFSECIKKNGGKDYDMKIRFGEQLYLCNGKNPTVSIKDQGKEGHLECPKNVNKFCRRKELCPNDCNMRGRCTLNGQCICYEGFSGRDCGNNITLQNILEDGVYVQKAEIQGCKNVHNTNKNMCSSNGTCMTEIGLCVCERGWKGLACKEKDFYVVTGNGRVFIPSGLDYSDNNNELKSKKISIKKSKKEKTQRRKINENDNNNNNSNTNSTSSTNSISNSNESNNNGNNNNNSNSSTTRNTSSSPNKNNNNSSSNSNKNSSTTTSSNYNSNENIGNHNKEINSNSNSSNNTKTTPVSNSDTKSNTSSSTDI